MRAALVHLPSLTPKKLLEEMDTHLPLVPGGNGKTVSEILRQYSNGSFNTVLKWKNEEMGFRARYEELMARTRYIDRPEGDEEGQLLEDFVDLFKKNRGRRSKAAKAVGKTWSFFKRRLDPQDKFFDRHFAEQYNYACQDIEALFSDRLHKKAFQDDVPGETRVLLHLHSKYCGDDKQEEEQRARKVELIVGELVDTLKITGREVAVS